MIMDPIVIKTSYFSFAKFVVNPINISSAPKSWFKNYDIKSFRKLAPPKDLVMLYKSGHLDIQEYTAIYNDKVLIQWLNGKELLDELIQNFGNRMTLLCWEKPSDFCHRHLVAKFLEKGTNIKVVEFDPNSPDDEENYETGSTEIKRE